MSASHKAGMVGGAVLAAGIGARSIDDCARVGARGARSIDDVAVRGVGVLDEAGHTRLGGLAEAAGGTRAAPRPASTAGGSHWLSHAADLGLDVGMEVLPNLDAVDEVDAEDEQDVAIAATAPSQVRCPRVVMISRTPDAWTELIGGVGIACAPIVLVATVDADGRSVEIGGQPEPLAGVVETCASFGGHCLVVGCTQPGAEACEQAVDASMRAVRPGDTLLAYEHALMRDLLARPGGPTLLAQRVVQDGLPQLAVARRGGRPAGRPK